MSKQEQPYEPEKCRECSAMFNLAGQYYYDDKCPSCRMESSDEEKYRTWPICTACDNRAPRGAMQIVRVKTRGRGTEHVPVCSQGCKGAMMRPERGRQHPKPIKKLDRGELPFFGIEAAILNKRFGGDDD